MHHDGDVRIAMLIVPTSGAFSWHGLLARAMASCQACSSFADVATGRSQ
jgi:hypothetical protein